MIYKYFISSEMQHRLDSANLGDDVVRHLKKFSQLNSELNASDLTSRLIVSKIQNNSGLRFIWFREIRQNVCVYVLRRIYRHDEYIKKVNDATKHHWIKRHELSDAEQAELEDLFASFFVEEKKENLPEEYRKYEDKRAFDAYHDVVFYELPLWSDGMKRVPDRHLQQVQEALPELAENNLSGHTQLGVFMYITTGSYCITFRLGTPNADGKSDVYLLQIVEGIEPNIDELLDRKYDREPVEDLQNLSSKCYPDYFTYELDPWIDIEHDDDANLALSEEEIKILQTVQFPFFVSGLAGSGKSTILYYLFANIYKYEARSNPEHRLIFLSYNKDLVDIACSRVRSILRLHPTNEGFKTYFDSEENLNHFNRSFKAFRDFLKNEFLDEDARKRFSEEKHITYETFIDLYNNRYKQAGRRLSPAILWSVIRTFIKGRRMDYFTPDDYASDEITRGDRTVDIEAFREAYRIWENWYRGLEREGYWDDLDLVRYVLSHTFAESVFHSYSVIFCDEAQDFTKLEIDLILKLSKHSEFLLSAHPSDRRIPIAFAGDPNQTISPTGFRWAGTKAIFNESFRDSLDSYPDLDDPELSKNYRSQLGIVKFANTIQSIRYYYFDSTSRDRKLQSVRERVREENPDALEYVAFYSFDQHRDVILSNLHNANVITAGDGEVGNTADFPDVLDWFNKHDQSENDAPEVGNRLKTAIGTKGLDYKAVMLLNFSNDPAYRLFQKIVNDQPMTDSERFEASHFFTKLYIAVSRAKEQLFIVDTDESYNLFWQYFINPEKWETLIERFVKDTEKRRLVGRLCMGNIDTLPQRLSDTYDPAENGRQAFNKAKGDRSITLMQSARSYFLEAQLTALAEECDAYIFLFNNKFEKAGDKFLSLNQNDKRQEAINAYWKGMCWQKLTEQIGKLTSPSSYDVVRNLAARFMTAEVTALEFVQRIVDSIDSYQDATQSHLEDRYIWDEIFGTMTTKMLALEPVAITVSLLNNLNLLSRYERYGQNLMPLRANLYFRRAAFFNEGVPPTSSSYRKEDYLQAIDLWERAGKQNGNHNYLLAKKFTSSSISEEIHWMNELHENTEIVTLYGGRHHEKMLDDEAGNIVFNSLLALNRYDEAIDYGFPKERDAKWNRLYQKDRKLFLTRVILPDFNQEKFYFLADRIEHEGSTVFDDGLSKEEYAMIFNLIMSGDDDKPGWVYFATSIKDERGNRVFKNNGNIINILDAISEQIISSINAGKESKLLSSYLLETLFDRDYNYGRTERYIKVLTAIFGQDMFFKEDFRVSGTRRNRYFLEFAALDGDQLNLIKSHICSFVKDYLSRCQKVTNATVNEVKALMRAAEVCVPYDEASTPLYAEVTKNYRKWLKDTKFSQVHSWMEQRLALNEYIDVVALRKHTFADFINTIKTKEFSIETFVNGLFIEDAAMLVCAINADNGDYTYEGTLLSARLLYQRRLRRDNLRPFAFVDGLVKRLDKYINIAIDELFNRPGRLNETEFKFLAFAWEAIYSRHADVAMRYNKLLAKPRLARLSIMTEYVKKRALLHYSYLDKREFEKKKAEYGIQMTKDYLPATYPFIGEKETKNNHSDPTSTDSDFGSSTTPTVAPKEKTTTKGKTRSSRSKSKSTKEQPIDATKQAYLTVAKNMKASGMSANEIMKMVPGLTIAEIEDL